MARIVFINIPARGHTNPTLALVKELVQRGETVIYYSFNEFKAAIEATGAEFRSYDQTLSIDPDAPDPNIFRFATQLLETAQILVPQLLPRVKADNPDVIIHDSLSSWGLYIARILKVRAICSTTTFAISSQVAVSSAADVMRFLRMIMAAPGSIFHFRRIANHLRRKYRVAPRVQADMFRNDSDLNIVYTSSAFQPFSDSFPKHYRFIGASIEEPPPSDFPLPPAKKRVYVSLGTLFNNNLPFFKTCFDALSGLDAHVVMSVGKKIAIDDLGTIPPNISVHSFVPQLDVLRQSDVFITHGGMNSVHESLWYGVPMVVVPQAADQMFVANRVESVGAGICMTNDDVSVNRIRTAVETLLSSASHKEISRRIGQSLRDAGGFHKAADEIQKFIAG